MTEAAMDPTTEELDQASWPLTKIPRPLSGGSYSVESLGHFLDKFLGDDKAAAEAAAQLEPFLMREEEMPPDPEPIDIPEPLSGATETINRDAGPGDKRS